MVFALACGFNFLSLVLIRYIPVFLLRCPLCLFSLLIVLLSVGKADNIICKICTIKVDALGSIISNCTVLLSIWGMTLETSIMPDTEMKVRIHGNMNTFRYLYGIMLGELLLKHAENLSCYIRFKIWLSKLQIVHLCIFQRKH